MIRWKRWWPDLPEDLPVDVMPASNGEFFPPPPTPEQRAIMALANSETERMRRKLGMSRRDFVRTAAAYTIGFWAINQVMGTDGGRYAVADGTKTNKACDLEFGAATGNFSLLNKPGEFIFDVQSHHVDSGGIWRATNPGFEAFFAAIWSQAGGIGDLNDPHWLQGDPTQGINTERGLTVSRGGREIDPIENLSRYHYLKELFLDSATTMTVLSAVPSSPDLFQPLPINEAALTVEMIRNLAGSERTVMHAFVMPNRGAGGTAASLSGQDPLFMQQEFDLMFERAARFGHLIRGWKVYTAWGDIPNASGWYFDDPVGERFLENVRRVSQAYPHVRPNVAVHKGFALPGFDQRAASPRDVGPAARAFPDVNFIVYHSGFDGERMDPYPGDDNVSSADRTVDSLIKSLRENAWDATRWPDGNVPNVYAEVGSTWRTIMGRGGAQGANLFTKLVQYVGPKRILYGTDALWFGSPQPEIAGLRALTFSNSVLPHGLEGDVESPQQPAPTAARSIRNAIFGYNAARAYGVDASLHVSDRQPRSQGGHPIACDDVQRIRDAYIVNPLTPRELVPLRSNQIVGPRTRRELLTMRRGMPWGP